MTVLEKKICMLGAPGVGKTSLVRRYVDSVFSDTTNAWALAQDGTWERVEPTRRKPHSHQAAMMRRARQRARRRRTAS